MQNENYATLCKSHLFQRSSFAIIESLVQVVITNIMRTHVSACMAWSLNFTEMSYIVNTENKGGSSLLQA